MTALAVEPRPIALRRLDREDETFIRELLEGLSQEDRFMRFMRGMPRIPDSVIAALSAVDGTNHVAVAAFDGTRCVAVARYLRLSANPTAAEVAVTVAEGYRRMGLARELILWLARDAAVKGIESFEVYVHPANEPAVGLADGLVVWIERSEQEMRGRVGVARLIQASPTPASTGRRHPVASNRTAARRRRIRSLAGWEAPPAAGQGLGALIETLR